MAGLFDWIGGLFGGKGAGAEPVAVAAEPEIYKDFRIFAEPIAEGSQYRLAGRIVMGEGDGMREHRFIRADVYSDRGEVEAAAQRKGRQIIDEQGMALFADRQTQ